MSFHLVYNLLLLQFVLGASLNPPDYKKRWRGSKKWRRGWIEVRENKESGWTEGTDCTIPKKFLRIYPALHFVFLFLTDYL